MPAPGAHRTGDEVAAREHVRRRSGRAAAGRRALLAVVLVVAAAAVLAALLLRPADGPGSGPDGAPASAAGAAQAPAATTSTAQRAAQGAAQAAALWLAGEQLATGGVAVDPGLYDELASSAQLAPRLVPAPTGPADEQVQARWVVAGPALRAGATPGSWAAEALAASHPVAVFGDGDARVEVREVGAAPPTEPVVPLADAGGPGTPSPPTPGPARSTAPAPATATAPPTAPATADPAALDELARNPRLDFSPRAREALRSEPVDLRVAALLVQLAAQQPLSVTDLPASEEGGEPVRTVVLDGLAGSAVGADPDALALLERQLAAQDPSYRATPSQEREGPTQVLRLVLPPTGP